MAGGGACVVLLGVLVGSVCAIDPGCVTSAGCDGAYRLLGGGAEGGALYGDGPRGTVPSGCFGKEGREGAYELVVDGGRSAC